MKAKSKRRDDYMIWIDCEMTGLDPDRHTLLEIATLITDSELHVIAEGPVLAIRQPEAALGLMDSWCRRTHKESGLLERVRTEGISVADAERRTLAFLRRHCLKRTAPLCGNSIGQDRRFLARYMPQLEDYFHYQSIDVSTVKQLVKRWYKQRIKPPEKQKLHLALADIRESITELEFYRNAVFVKPS